MVADIWEYFEDRKLECERLGLTFEKKPQFVSRKGTNEQEGRIELRLGLPAYPNAWIAVMERVVIRDRSVRRESYGYYLFIDEQEYMARDLDSVHGYHGHGRGHVRIEAGRVTFKEFVELAWEVAETEAELAIYGDEPMEGETLPPPPLAPP